MNRNLPHIILDSTVDNVNILGKVFNNLPDDIDPDQRLSLEGNFNDYLSLYAPKDYERDAFYIFTPDLMALLIDGATWCDVEIVDNQIYFYSAYHKFDYAKEMEFVWKAFHIMNIMGAKLYNQTDYYADERIGNRQLDIVADQGKRLKITCRWLVLLSLCWLRYISSSFMWLCCLLGRVVHGCLFR